MYYVCTCSLHPSLPPSLSPPPSLPPSPPSLPPLPPSPPPLDPYTLVRLGTPVMIQTRLILPSPSTPTFTGGRPFSTVPSGGGVTLFETVMARLWSDRNVAGLMEAAHNTCSTTTATHTTYMYMYMSHTNVHVHVCTHVHVAILHVCIYCIA